jgi:hypothetical protein
MFPASNHVLKKKSLSFKEVPKEFIFFLSNGHLNSTRNNINLLTPVGETGAFRAVLSMTNWNQPLIILHATMSSTNPKMNQLLL